VAAAAVLALVLVAALALRRRSLTRVRGSFDCSVRLEGQRWALGVARVGTQRVEWWKVLSLSPRPRRTLLRRDLSVTDRRWPEGGESAGVLPAAVVVRCRHQGSDLDLAMSQEAYTGFAAWLESAPPGPQSSVT
jgi:hypothetical protein